MSAHDHPSACWRFAELLRAGDGLGERSGAAAVLERAGARFTRVWGVLKPTKPDDVDAIHWLRNEGVNMHPLTEDEARTEAARHPEWQVVFRDDVEVTFSSGWELAETPAEPP